MAIQNRRGDYNDFDPQQLVPGEWAVVLSGDPHSTRGKAVYMAFDVGEIERMATYEDMQENIVSATTDVQAQFAAELTQTIADANDAVSEMQHDIDAEIELTESRVTALTTQTNNTINSARQATTQANDASETAFEAAESVRSIIESGQTVASWNNRTGLVVPLAGDYTSEQITHGSGTVASALTFDYAPTEGSQRAVQSGGVYSILGNADMGTTATTVTGAIAELQSNMMQFHVFRFPNISAETDTAAIASALQDILNRNLGDITFVCYVFRTGAWQLNGFGSVRNGDARATFINSYNGQILVVSKTATTAINVIKTYS